MLQSQQLDTRLVLAANDEFAAGLLIQRMPVAGAANLAGASAARDEDQIGMNEDYKRIALLAGTLQRDELLTLDAAVLLRRLFWQETLRLFEPRQRAPAPQPGLAMPMAGGPAAPAPALPLRPQFACSCSRERVATMLRGLGAQEIGSLIAEHGQAEIGCDFCGAQYHFDPVDAAGLFTPGSIQPPAAAGLH